MLKYYTKNIKLFFFSIYKHKIIFILISLILFLISFFLVFSGLSKKNSAEIIITTNYNVAYDEQKNLLIQKLFALSLKKYLDLTEVKKNSFHNFNQTKQINASEKNSKLFTENYNQTIHFLNESKYSYFQDVAKMKNGEFFKLSLTSQEATKINFIKQTEKLSEHFLKLFLSDLNFQLKSIIDNKINILASTIAVLSSANIEKHVGLAYEIEELKYLKNDLQLTISLNFNNRQTEYKKIILSIFLSLLIAGLFCNLIFKVLKK